MKLEQIWSANGVPKPLWLINYDSLWGTIIGLLCLRTFDADRISLYVQTKTMVEDPLECHVTVIFNFCWDTAKYWNRC